MLCRVRDTTTSTFVTDNVTYLINNGILTRTSSRVGGSDPAKTIEIARYIDDAGTTLMCENVTQNSYFTLTVTATSNNATVTKVYKMNQVLH
jgi:hypothetical protein